MPSVLPLLNTETFSWKSLQTNTKGSVFSEHLYYTYCLTSWKSAIVLLQSYSLAIYFPWIGNEAEGEVQPHVNKGIALARLAQRGDHCSSLCRRECCTLPQEGSSLIGMQGYFKAPSFNLQLRLYCSLVKIFINQNLLLPSPGEKRDEHSMVLKSSWNLRDGFLMLAKTCSDSGI